MCRFHIYSVNGVVMRAELGSVVIFGEEFSTLEDSMQPLLV